ncbi:MAG: response receiver sensor histidine kinase response regulator [Fibrobacteres bacterium]|nr:response receiver sensor histidine kinase response regulator [Fibrobacterota bacterium]
MTPSLRLLLVDDNPDDRSLVLRALKKEFPEIEATEVIDAEGLDSALFRGSFDLAITDYQLLWSNGLEVVARVKFCFPDCPIIMFTATGNEEIAVEGLKNGLNDYVLKSSHNFARLASAVRIALEHAGERRRSRHLDFRLQDLLTRLNVGVCRADLDGRIIYANPAFFRIFGLVQESAGPNLDINALIPMPMEPAALRDELTRNGQVRLPEMQVDTAAQKAIWISAMLTLNNPGGNGNVLAEHTGAFTADEKVVEFLVEDITERKRLDQELKEREEEVRELLKLESIGRLAGGVAHDFNNLLTAINGYSELLLGMLHEDSPLHESVVEIMKAGTRAANLTRELLAFSRRQILQPREFDLNLLIESMKPKLRRLVGESVVLEISLDPAPARVRCDGSQMENVILNLASNARDAMPQGGRLSIRTATLQVRKTPERRAIPRSQPATASKQNELLGEGSYVVLTFEDSGIGMTSEILERVFEPFFTTKVMGKGTGMGLSSAYGIVKQSGGHIFVDSEPERGACFRICLPQAARVQEPDLEPA